MHATELDPRRWWALALLCGAFFMVILDAAIVTVALPSIRARPRLLGAEPPVGRQRLRPDVRGPASPRRARGRPARATARVHGRPRRLHGRVAPLRARVVAGRADRSPRAPGSRRRDHDPDGALDHHRPPSKRAGSGTRPSASGARWAESAPRPHGSSAVSSWTVPAGSGSSSSTSRSASLRSRSRPVLLKESRAETVRAKLRPRRRADDHRCARACSSTRSSRRRTRAGAARRRSSCSLAPRVLLVAFVLIERGSGAARAPEHLPVAHAGRRQPRDALLRRRRLRDAVHPHPLHAAGARLLGRQVRAHLGRFPVAAAVGSISARRSSSGSASGRSPRRAWR